MNLEKIDKIIVDYSQLEEISSWVKAQNFKTIDMPFYETFIMLKNIEFNPYKVDISGITKTKKQTEYYRNLQLENDSDLKTNMDIGIYFNVGKEGNDLTIKIYDMKDMYMMVKGVINQDFFTKGKLHIQSVYQDRVTQEYFEKLIKVKTLMVFDIFQYMTNRTEHIHLKEKSMMMSKPRSKKKQSKNNRSKYVKVKIKEYTFDTNPNPNPKEYNRHTHSWTVRGHWRYYKKTGKRVWVNGYTKGKGEPEGKIYKI